MDPTKLSERLRAIVKTTASVGLSRQEAVGSPAGADRGPVGSVDRPEAILGGEWHKRDGASCFVVERRQPPDATYGRERVQAIALRLAEASAEAALVMGTPGPPPFLFFDLETTGLSGGAGTYAFLIGCGMFDADGGFVTRQFVLLRPADERQLLQGFDAELSRAGALVSFNGKSFDAPLIETRHLYHRLEWDARRIPHLDVLHPARRFWGDVRERQGGDTPCSLAVLERSVLGARRKGDVPGFEIPARYFEFLRSGDAGPLAGVLEHNRLDLLSLAGLAARLLDLVKRGPVAARHAQEALALGRVYAQRGLDSRAREAFECAITHNGSASPTQHGSLMGSRGQSAVAGRARTAPVQISALRSLGHLSRRAQRFNEAADYWQRLVDTPGCPAHVVREATEALAVHHEHRAHDLFAAKAFALRSLAAAATADEPRRRCHDQAVRHRLARIERKLGESQASRLKFVEP